MIARSRKFACMLAGSALFADRADAHLVSTELGPFYDGAAHPFVTPEDVLLITAVAALAGLRGAEGGRRALVGLCIGWAVAASGAFGLALPFAGALLIIWLAPLTSLSSTRPRWEAMSLRLPSERSARQTDLRLALYWGLVPTLVVGLSTGLRFWTLS